MRLAPLDPSHTALVQPLAARAFDDLAQRQGRPPEPSSPETERYWRREHEHLLEHGTCLGAFDDDADDDRLLGAALSYARGDLWVLALLVLDPAAQSGGTGSALLRAVLDGAPPRRLLHASRDERALRAYARAGFRLLPALEAHGTPALSGGPDLVDVEPTGPLAVDLVHALGAGARLLGLADGRPGQVLLAGPPGTTGVTVLAAPDDATAADLLRGALSLVPGPVRLAPLAPQEHWAVGVALEAGLALGVTGPVAVAGVADPLAGPTTLQAVYV